MRAVGRRRREGIGAVPPASRERDPENRLRVRTKEPLTTLSTCAPAMGSHRAAPTFPPPPTSVPPPALPLSIHAVLPRLHAWQPHALMRGHPTPPASSQLLLPLPRPWPRRRRPVHHVIPGGRVRHLPRVAFVFPRGAVVLCELRFAHRHGAVLERPHRRRLAVGDALKRLLGERRRRTGGRAALGRVHRRPESV